jgi:hypothetical protein
MTRKQAGGFWACLESDLSPAAVSLRLAGDLIDGMSSGSAQREMIAQPRAEEDQEWRS